MKFTITFKTPHATDTIKIRRCDSEECQYGPDNSDCPECNALEDEYFNARELVGQYIEYGEYITIEFDTTQNTASVIKPR